MNYISFCLQRTVFLVFLATITTGIVGIPATAETFDSSIGDSQEIITESNESNQGENTINPADETELAEEEFSSTPKPVAIIEEEQEIESEAEANTQPIPGTTKTSVSAFQQQSDASFNSEEVAQFEDVDPGRQTRTGSSYVGIGGNVGLAGDLALGDFGFALFSKIGLTRDFSARPTLIFSDEFDFLLPLTYDFRFESAVIYPYIGGGLLISSGDGTFGGLLTAGVDVPISQQFTATGSFNVGFTGDGAAIGFILGFGYNFGRGFEF